MPSKDIFGWDMGLSLSAILGGGTLPISLMVPSSNTYSDPDDNFIGDILDPNETVDSLPVTLVLGATLNVTYTPTGGSLTGPIPISGYIVVATGLLDTIIRFVPEDPDSVDPNLISGSFLLGSSTVAIGATTNFEICFGAGTMILTDCGERPIEQLKVGDLVQTMDNGLQTIRWIHANTVPARADLAPIEFRVGALGNTKDLTVSPQHRMLINDWRALTLFGEREVLATAKSLVNDTSI